MNGLEAAARASKLREQRQQAENAYRAATINCEDPPTRLGQSPLTAQQQALIKLTVDKQNAAEAYRDELLTYSSEQIDALIAVERMKHALEQETKHDLDERNRFFHRPDANADFSHWCKRATWTLDQAIALSLGKNPKRVNWKNVSPLTLISAFAKEYEARREIADCAVWAKQLFDPVYPSTFLAWAKTKFDPLPAELLQAALDDGISLLGWKDLYEGLVTTSKQNLSNQAAQNQKHVEDIAQLYKSKLEEVYAELGTAKLEAHSLKLKAEAEVEAAPDKDKPLRDSERENLQAMASLCAFRGYGFDPGRKNSASRQIRDDLAGVGYSLSDDRILKQLQSGITLLGPSWREKLKVRPKS